MPAASIHGHVLHYRLEGDGSGPVVAFSNSLGTDYRVWDPLLPYLPEGWRLLRYDTAGHGLSEHPGDHGIEDHAGDLLGLLDALSIDKAVIVGLSVGGMIAQALAARAPQRVAVLVLSNTAPKIGNDEVWNQRISGVETDGIAALSEGVLERWFSQRFREERPEELALWRAMLTRTPVESYIALCKAIRDADLTAATAKLDVPTLCIGGSVDGSTPPETVKAMAESIAGARYAEIDGAGHLPGVEAPEATAAEIVRFVKESGLE
jgi:3-oxoadipate enol-lactonase